MKRLLFAPLAVATLLLSSLAASAAPHPPRHLSPREQARLEAERARWETRHRPAPRPEMRRPAPQRPLPPQHQPTPPRPAFYR